MKTLVMAMVIGFFPSLLLARESDEKRPATTANSIAARLLNEVEAAAESGDEALLATLIQQFRQQFPHHLLGREVAQSLDEPSLMGNQAKQLYDGFDLVGSHVDSVFHVVPPAYSGTPGTATFLGPLANAQRTYQLLIEESQLTGLVGQRLTALSWRIPTSATAAWPVGEVSFTGYDVYLSGSVTPANRSLTFAANVIGQQTQVRSGALIVPSESYPFGGSPNGWGPEITFTPWLYAGGHLLVEIRHTGFTGTSRSVDAIGTTISGYGTLFSAAWTGNYAGTSGSQGNFAVVRLTADSITVSVGEDRRNPTTLTLDQNYPNPFNPSTTITFNIPVSGRVQLSVYDVLGNDVATLVNTEMRSGDHSVVFDASRLASGTYFYRLQSGGFVQTKRLLVLR